MKSVPATLRTLLEGALDYAGLFPPAALPMAEVVRNYAAYGSGAEAWMLGRCVIPAARLDEFRVAAGERASIGRAGAWRVSALTGADPAADGNRIRAFMHAGAPEVPLEIESIETAATIPADIDRLVELLPREYATFVEIPVHGDPGPLLGKIAAAGMSAKVRTGGTSPGAFPDAEDLAFFIHCAVSARVPFKATAGLHHPLRGVYRLTYEDRSPEGTMFGFLNVLLGGVFAAGGLPVRDILSILTEERSSAFRFSDAEVRWGRHAVSNDDLRRLRSRVAVSFGSCSFTEPLDDLRSLGFL